MKQKITHICWWDYEEMLAASCVIIFGKIVADFWAFFFFNVLLCTRVKQFGLDLLHEFWFFFNWISVVCGIVSLEVDG